MNKNILSFVLASCLVAPVASHAAITVAGYDMTNVRASGYGTYSYSYTGTKSTPVNSLINLTGGSGSLTDGIIPNGATVTTGDQLFNRADGSSITLFLSDWATVSTIDLFGGNPSSTSAGPWGALTGATVTIGNVSVALSSTGWNSAGVTKCSAYGGCNDTLSLLGTSLQNVVTKTITLSNFSTAYKTTQNVYQFTLGEVNVGATLAAAPVPEPETSSMLFSGLFMLGWMIRRRVRND